MIKTTYQCDRCGGVQNTKVQFSQIGVGAIPIDDPYRPIIFSSSMHVCRQCLEELGINDRRSPEVKKVNPPPTLEDLIREICAKEISRSE